jgi:hypothetical protein
MSLYSREDGDGLIQPDLIAEALEQLVAAPPPREELQGLSAYELNLLLKRLRASAMDEDRLGLLEWRLLPALGFEARSPVLHRRLARDPRFFVEIMSLLFRPRSSSETDTGTVPEHVARNAWRLLHEWKIVPGTSEEVGVVDEDELMAWVVEARQLLRRRTGARSAMCTLDKSSPTPAAMLTVVGQHGLSGTRSSDLPALTSRMASVRRHTTNRRPTSRNPSEDGQQERALAERYRTWAALVRDEWPRTSLR